MITKNFKTLTLLMMTIGIATAGMIMSGNVFASAAETNTSQLIPTYTVTQSAGLGKNIVKFGQQKSIDPDMIKLLDLSARSEDPSVSESEKQSLAQQMTELQDRIYEKITNVPSEKLAEIEKNREIFNKAYLEKLNNIGFEDIRAELPYSTLGVDREEQAIRFGFTADYLTDENITSYFQKIRDILGNDMDIVITSSERYTTAACTSQTSNCDPLVGGIKINMDWEDCSIAFKAKRNTDNGFVTAGHCSNGSASPNLTVYQAGWPRNVGVLTVEEFHTNSYCDCAFVKVNSGITVDDTIYSNIEPLAVGTPTVGTAVTAKGFASGTKSGQITDSSEDVWVSDSDEGSIYLRDQLIVDFVVSDGDSGGIVYKNSNKDLMGIISAKGSTTSIISKASRATTEISGLSWDFT